MSTRKVPRYPTPAGPAEVPAIEGARLPPPGIVLTICCYCGFDASGPTEVIDHVATCPASPWPARLAEAREEGQRAALVPPGSGLREALRELCDAIGEEDLERAQSACDCASEVTHNRVDRALGRARRALAVHVESSPATDLCGALQHVLHYHGHSNVDTDCPACGEAHRALARAPDPERLYRAAETLCNAWDGADGSGDAAVNDKHFADLRAALAALPEAPPDEARDENGRCVSCLRKPHEAHTLECRAETKMDERKERP